MISARAKQLLTLALYDRDDARDMCLSSIRRHKTSNPKRVLELSLRLEEALKALPERTKRILKKSSKAPVHQVVRALTEQRRVYLLYTDKR